MILFDICAVRSILFTITVYLGIATPPILISQTRQLISHCHVLSTIYIDLSTFPGLHFNQQEQLTSSSEPPLSLELTMFNGTFCPALSKNSSNTMNHTFLAHGLNSNSNKLHPEGLNQYDKDQLTLQHLITSLFSNKMDTHLTEGTSTLLVYHNSSTHDHDMPGWQSIEFDLYLDLENDGQWEENIASHVNQRVVHLTLKLTLSLVLNETIESTTLTSGRQELLDWHHPLPGSDYGVMWYHEQLRTYLRNTLLNALPHSWAKWMTTNRPLLGIICVTVMYGSLLWPLLGGFWKQMQAKRKLIKELKTANRARHVTDSLVLKLKERQEVLIGKLSEADKHSHKMDELVNSHIEKLSQANKDKVIIENQMSEQVSKVNRLEDDAQVLLEKVAVLDSKCSQLQSTVADLTEQKQSLEIENQVLKCAKEASISSLISLQASYDKTSEDLSTIKEGQAVLEYQLSFTSEELNIKTAKSCEQNKELKELSDCLSLVTSQTAMLACLNSEGDVLDKKVEESDKEDTEMKCPLPDVQIILGNVEAEITYQQSKQQSQQLRMELDMKESLLKEHAAEINGLQDRIVFLETESKITTDQLHKHELKFKGIIEYFHSKENKLYKKLASTEIKLQQSEQLATECREKQLLAEERIEKDHKQLMEIKEQLEAVNKSLIAQVCVNNERAYNAMKFARDTERHLRLANRKIAELNRRYRFNVKKEPSILKQNYLSTNKTHINIPQVLHNAPISPKTSSLHLATSCHHKTYGATELRQASPSIKEPVLSNHTPFCLSSLFKTRRKVQRTRKVSILDQTKMVEMVDIDSSLRSMSMSVPSSAKGTHDSEINWCSV